MKYKLYSFDINLDLMILIVKLDIDRPIVKMYVHTENEVSSISSSCLANCANSHCLKD